MKDCCKTSDEEPEKKKSWLKWLLYIFLFLALGLVLFDQITT